MVHFYEQIEDWSWDNPFKRHSTVWKAGKGDGQKSRSLFFVQLALLMMKFTKWAWKLCNVSLQRLVLASATIEGLKNANGKQAIKMCNHLGVLKRSRQVIWMSGVVELEVYFPGSMWFYTEDSHYSQSPALGDILTFSSRSPSTSQPLLIFPLHLCGFPQDNVIHSYLGLCKPKYLQIQKLASRARHLFH